MVEDLARALHLSPTVFYMLFFTTLVIGSLALGFALNRIVHHWTKKVANAWGELVFSLLESLPVPLLLLGSIYVGLETLKLPHRFERVGSKLILALTVVVIFYFPSKVLVFFLRRVGQRNPSVDRVTNLSIVVVKVLFALLAIVVVLENLGISLTAIWTTLGVGSVAVALALQETLSNLFAGLYLLADRPVNPGITSSWTAARKATRCTLAGVPPPSARWRATSCLFRTPSWPRPSSRTIPCPDRPSRSAFPCA